MAALQRLDPVMSAQKVLFNGRKHVLAIKFQSVVAPNDLIVNLFDTLHENVVVLLSLVHGGAVFSLSADMLTSLICFQVFTERIELHVT